MDRRGARRCDRDREAKQVRGLGERTCADAEGNERDCEERHRQCQEPLAGVERFRLFFAFVIGDMGGVLGVAGA
ncbi:MAG TPA: hypothetical protein VFT35_05505 [Gaiellaceae bacterium]|nr:hypothetical protein [Gaiellaceae bacterium]